MPQQQRGGRVVEAAEKRQNSIIPWASISCDSSAVIPVLCQYMAAAGTFFPGRDCRCVNGPLADAMGQPGWR